MFVKRTHDLSQPYVCILGTHHYGNTCLEAFKRLSRCLLLSILCRTCISPFLFQIQSEYYDVNLSVSIERIVLEHFSAKYKGTSSLSLHSCKYRSAFNSFLYDNRKQDASTTTSHTKTIIELFESRKLFFLYE